MNCARPSAPTGETAFGFHPASVWSWAATSDGVSTGQVAAALLTHGR